MVLWKLRGTVPVEGKRGHPCDHSSSHEGVRVAKECRSGMEGKMMPRLEEHGIETDVLIIGGGLAGCMAGIKAKERDVDVLIVEKSHTLASGQAGSGVDHIWGYFPPVHEKMGWTLEDLVEDHMQGVACGFAQPELIRFVAGKMHDRLLDLESFGIQVRFDDSPLPGKFRMVYQFHSVPTSLNNENMETEIPGLFAAGDEVAGVPFGAAPAAFTTGWHAGKMAAKQAARIHGAPEASAGEPLDALRVGCAKMMAEDGFTWCEVEDTLQNIMDAYCGDLKTGHLLKRGLDRVHFLNEQPIRVTNAHELSRALEVKSLLDNAEMIIRASIARKETRKHPCGFFRKDFPEQDDENWFAFSSIRLENGTYIVSRLPLNPQK